MLLRTITLSNSGNVCLDGGGYILALGYECTRGIYQLQLRPTGEWEGLTIRACWHLPDGTSTTTLAVDGYVDVPATVTALPGTGCITFEGAAEGKTITSSDLRYLVGDNSGVEDGALPEPNTPAWEQLVGTVAESAAQAEEAADRADKAAAAAEGTLTAVEGTVSKALTDITHTGTDQIQAVTRAGEQAVKEVDAAAQTGVGSVEQTKQTATQAVQTAATAAIQRVEQTGGTQVQAIAAAGAAQVKKIEDAAAEKLEGIKEANAHAPQPNPATGKWQVWDTESGQYMDTAVPYQGGYYTPTMAEDGTLTWTGSQPDMPALPSANIRGPQGLGVPNPSQEAAGKVPTVTDAGDGYQLTGPYAPLASALRPTVKGNPAVCEESIAWGFQGLKVYGKSVQDGVPTPENPVPILSAGGGGEISVTVSGGATANQNLTISTPDGLLGFPVKSGGTFIDSSGEQWKSDYRDYAAGSDFQWVGKTIVDGAENKFIADDVYWNLKFGTSPNIEHLPGVLSQYFGQNAFSSNTNYDFLFTIPARMNLYGINTIDELNQLCQKWNTDGDPLTICYTMREPIITPIPPEELAAYRALTTYDGTTVVSTTEPVAGLEVKYVADATNAIIDDTVITPDKTWSSLRILDTLCPPIQATGNPVVCHPVAGYPLNVTVDFAPIQEGEGDPSPENIRPIKARESVDVTRCGANLLNITPFAPIERNGIKFEYVASGGIRITGTADKLTDSPVWPLALPPRNVQNVHL